MSETRRAAGGPAPPTAPRPGLLWTLRGLAADVRCLIFPADAGYALVIEQGDTSIYGEVLSDLRAALKTSREWRDLLLADGMFELVSRSPAPFGNTRSRRSTCRRSNKRVPRTPTRHGSAIARLGACLRLPPFVVIGGIMLFGVALAAVTIAIAIVVTLLKHRGM